ncbi:Hypoxia-responsive family protein-like [Zostera marina]|uniref:Hypoxia-responsive family protein-like n=1 Tax=Zostera marina TaxID=29655 RepID=A0A0K9PP57_ZOSMR|nr:Hypoxia-responsive family protein-like [Zostera marina]
MAEKKDATSMETFRKWIIDNKLKAVGCLWLSGVTGSVAYNWSQPAMKTSVKLIHARLHAQALTLAALAGAAGVEYYDRQHGPNAVKCPKDRALTNKIPATAPSPSSPST